ncbi:MAG: hypothetical protein FWF09_02885, partial [Bacteroidales bacterium]|nr:hypothetical protein [Bacteroidales bacterium]
TYAQTLHPTYYSKNPNFLKSEEILKLEFKPHVQFKKEDIEERQKLVQRICEAVWASDFYNIENEKNTDTQAVL